MESEVKIFETSRNGKTFKNIDLKKGNLEQEVMPLGIDKYVVVERLREMPLQNKFNPNMPNYLVIVLYKGEEVSFFMNSKEFESYSKAGEVGDKIRLFHKRQTYQHVVDGVSVEKKFSFIESTPNSNE